MKMIITKIECEAIIGKARVDNPDGDAVKIVAQTIVDIGDLAYARGRASVDCVRVRVLVDALEHELQRERSRRDNRGGQQVPNHGDFASAPPSTLDRLAWWVRELRAGLDPNDAPPPPSINDLLNVLSKSYCLTCGDYLISPDGARARCHCVDGGSR